MVCNSHPALPLCCPCCWRCFHTALVWLHKEKRQEGISSRNNIGHFSPLHSGDSKKFAGSEKKALPLTLFLFPFASSTVTMCPISSSPFLSLPQLSCSLQVTGVSCNMLCFPTWVLMRHMNIHEEEADIAVWRLCRGCLRAQTLWWTHFWGICCAAGRHQGTLGSSANDADVCPWVLFWSVIVDDPFPRPLLSPWWLLAELKFSLQLLVEDSQGAQDWEEELSLSLPTLFLLVLFLPVLLACDKQMPWAASLGRISILLLYFSLFLATTLYLFIFCVSCIFCLGTYSAVMSTAASTTFWRTYAKAHGPF